MTSLRRTTHTSTVHDVKPVLLPPVFPLCIRLVSPRLAIVLCCSCIVSARNSRTFLLSSTIKHIDGPRSPIPSIFAYPCTHARYSCPRPCSRPPASIGRHVYLTPRIYSLSPSASPSGDLYFTKTPAWRIAKIAFRSLDSVKKRRRGLYFCMYLPIIVIYHHDHHQQCTLLHHRYDHS